MSTTYQFSLATPFGVTLVPALIYERAEYVLSEMQVGALTMRIPSRLYPLDYFARDYRLTIGRGVAGRQPALEGDATWLIRRRRYLRDQRIYEVTALHANHLLARRIVAYAAGSSQATKTGTADNLMKAVVRENLTAATDAARNLSSSLFAVQADTSAAASVSMSFSRDNVLATLQQLAQASATAGTYCGFEVRTVAGVLTFVTYTGQRGVDRRAGSSSALIIGPDYRNLAETVIDEDWSAESTYIYAAGQGQGSARLEAMASSSAVIARSPFGRIEALKDGRNTADSTQLQDDADAALYAARARASLEGAILDAPQSTYGIHYGWGDRVTAQVDSYQVDALIDPVHITVDQSGGEVRDIRIRSIT